MAKLLLISILFFFSYLVSSGTSYPAGLRVAAWISLFAFLALTSFLAFALRWTEATIRFALGLTLLRRLRPRMADRI